MFSGEIFTIVHHYKIGGDSIKSLNSAVLLLAYTTDTVYRINPKHLARRPLKRQFHFLDKSRYYYEQYSESIPFLKGLSSEN
jgi:hypothetical protein